MTRSVTLPVALLAVSLAAALALTPACPAEPKLPVVSLSYGGTAGSTAAEEEWAEETGEASWESVSYRHQGTLRIREEWSRDLVSTLVSEVARKLYVGGTGVSYTAVQISPQTRWTIAEGLKWDATLLLKRSLYDEPYATGDSRDYTRLRVDTGLSVGLARGITLVHRLQATLEPHDDAARSLQRWGVGVSLDARVGRWSFGADYRGTLRLELGQQSEVQRRADHAFGANVSWDPNGKVGSRDETEEE